MADPSGDAFATLKTILDRYGLGTLSSWAWGQLVAGRSENEIMLDLYERPEFKQRFPAIDLRRQAGLPAVSPAEYVAYESQARQMMRAAGFPPGFYDQPDDFTNLIARDVSTVELDRRLQTYTQAAFQTPPEYRAQLSAMFGVDEGGLAAYYADPDRALPVLENQWRAAQVAGAAVRNRFGPLTASEAERLAALGVTPEQAEQGFGFLAQGDELFKPLPGEGDGIGRDTQLALVGGDAGAAETVRRKVRQRQSPFEQGGSFAAGSQGVGGLGSANR